MAKPIITSAFHKMKSFFEKNPLGFPILLLITALITYGVFIFSLGFYWDDWPPILLSHMTDKSMVLKYFTDDRPFQAWTYYVLFPICRDSTFAWQLSGIIFRWSSALALYYAFLQVFTKQKKLLQWAAILFVVFPGFSYQYVSVSFGSHFMTYTAFGLSLLTMVLAIKKREQFWIFFPLSLFLTAVHLFTMEYFVGLEVLRPILIFILLSESEEKKSKTFLKTLKNWMPYIAVFSIYIYWRMVLYPAAVGGNHANNYPFLVANFFKAPLDTLITFFQTVYSDLRFLFLSTWTDRLLPVDAPFNSITFWSSLFIGFAVSGLLGYFLFDKESLESFRLKTKEVWGNILIALSIILFGMLPIWSTLRQITVGKWSDRFDLAAIFGVVLLLSTVLFAFIQNPKIRSLMFILLVGFSISYQIRTGNDYRKDFIRQEAFYTQLKWRIPTLEAGTALYSPTIGTEKEADYSYSMGINLLYHGDNINPSVDYWFSGPRYYAASALVADPTLAINGSIRLFNFSGSASKVISIYKPPSGCLWVVDPYYALMPTSFDNFPLYGKLTNQDLIVDQDSGKNGLSPLFDFGAQSDWCYYFEKGDLAQSKEQWETAITYYEQAKAKHLVPLEGIEYLPFIKAYVKLGRIEDAVSLTGLTYKKSYFTKPLLCQFWHDALKESPTSSLLKVGQVYNAEVCPSFFNPAQ